MHEKAKRRKENLRHFFAGNRAGKGVFYSVNGVYTDTGVRITIDIDDAENAALSPCHSVTWNIGCQYNNFNMPDNFRRVMSALGKDKQVSASGGVVAQD